MRKALLVGVLGVSLLTGACTSIQSTDSKEGANVNFYQVNEKNGRDILEVAGEEITSKDFKMNLEFTDDMIKVAVTNTSEEVIVIDWGHARYTGLDGEDQRIFNMKQKDGGFYTRQAATPLRPGQSYIAELVPVKNLKHIEGSSTGLGTIYIEKKMFVGEKEFQKNDYAKLEVPITIGGVKKGSLKKYEVFFGEGDKPATLVEKEVVAVAPVTQVKETAKEEAVVETPEILKIQSENDLLEQELKSKDLLIEQLNEKAKLQKELEKKQKEIDALIKGLN